MKLIILLLISANCFAGNLQNEQRVQNGKKVCIYDDGSTLTIDQLMFCPMNHSSIKSNPPQYNLTPISDLERLGKDSLIRKYCSLLSRENALKNSAMNTQSNGNPLSASLALSTASAAAASSAERGRVGGVLEARHGVYMNESSCN